jgi:hypothetical protein
MILGINFDGIHVEKNAGMKGELKIDHNTKIIGINEMQSSDGKTNVAKIDFEFVTNYTNTGKKVAVIGLRGHLFYNGIDKKAVEEWKKSKKLEQNISVPVMNSIIRRCLVRAVSLAEDVMLPPPIQLPVVTSSPAAKKDEKKKK